MKKLTVFLPAFVFVMHTAAQNKSTHSVEQVWAGYFNQTRISGKWGIWFDAQLRTKDNFFQDLSVSIIRPGLTYYVNDAVRLTAGYAYITHYPQDNYIESRPEHRPWQQVQWHTRYGRNRMAQYIRLEERFRRKISHDSVLAPGHQFNFRVRYNLLWQIPLTKTMDKGGWSLVLHDELHIGFGKEVVYNYFDQNRFFAGLAFHLNAYDQMQLGYLNLFQQLPAGNRYRGIHAVRLLYSHNLDLRTKKAS